MAKEKPKLPPKRIRKQIRQYGMPFAELSRGDQWYQRHKRARKRRPVNPYIPFPREPKCYGMWEDDRCGVCGQSYEQFVSGVTLFDGQDLIREYARRENIVGGGYKSRGAVLYAMAVIKRNAFYQTHSLRCCFVVAVEEGAVGEENFNFFPFPKIVWYLSTYGEEDGKSLKNVREADRIRDEIQSAIDAGATRLRDFQYLKKPIRLLEKKYQYKDWWRSMSREHEDGIFYKVPQTADEGESLFELFPTSDNDILDGDLPF